MSTYLKKKVQKDINRCEEIIQTSDTIKAKEFVEQIVNIYTSHIKDITSGLSFYTRYEETDHIKDITILKGRLELLLAEIRDNLYHPVNSKSGIVLNNQNQSSNYNRNDNSITNNIDFNILFKQIREDVMSNESFTQEQTQEILGQLEDIEEVANSEVSKKEKWSKLKKIMQWLTTKGVDIAVKIIPVVLAIIKPQEE